MSARNFALPLKAWAVINRAGKIEIWNGQCPVFWLRRVARDTANEHGLTTQGSDANVSIRRVTISEGKS